MNPMTRREAGRRIVLTTAGLVSAPALLAGAGQMRQQGQGGVESILEKVLTRGRERDWTLKVTININTLDTKDPKTGLPNQPLMKFSTAAVIFPVLYGTGSSETWIDSTKGEVRLNDRVQDSTIEYRDGYPSGARFGRWEMRDMEAREVEMYVEIPMTCWETKYDEQAAERVEWPQGWPASAASALGDDPYVQPGLADIQKLVQVWTKGKDPRSVKPAVLAKFFAGQVLELVQISGLGTTTADNGLIEGFEVRLPDLTAREGLGTEHDVTVLLASVYRAAGLPARVVIGYDISEQKGEDRNFLDRKGSSKARLRSWVEFCLFDEGAQKEAWIPVDIVRLRERSSRAGDLNKPWKYFGSHDALDDTLPFAFQFHPPVAGVVAHGSPAVYGWFTTPETQVAEQFLRFQSQTTPKRSNKPRDSRRGG